LGPEGGGHAPLPITMKFLLTIKENSKAKEAAFLVLLALAVVAAYLPSLGGGFPWDGLSMAKGVSNFPPFLEASYERPLFNMSMALDEALWGGSPWGFHLTNLLLHLATAGLLYILTLRLFKKRYVALAAASLFALHPAAVDAVAWVSARAELLTVFFCLSAFMFYLSYDETGRPASLLASALLYLLALLSAQRALVFPLMVLLYGIVLRRDGRRLARSLALYVSLTACVVLLSSGPGEFRPAGNMAIQRLYDGLLAFGYYMGHLMAPVNLNLLPSLPETAFLALLALLPFVLMGLFMMEGKRRFVLLIGWVILAIIPSLPVALTDEPFPVGARFLYFPTVVLALFLAYAMGHLKNRKAFAGLLIPVLALAMTGTMLRVQDWRSPVALWEDTAAKTPAVALPRIMHGAALAQAGMYDQAYRALAGAAAQNGVTQEELLLAMRVLGNQDDERGERMVYAALNEARGQARANYGMGFVFYKLYEEGSQGKETLEKAVAYLERASDLSPNFAPAHYYLGLSYLELNQWPAAEEQFALTQETDRDGLYSRKSADFLKLVRFLRDKKGEKPTRG
jgi:tetratricopeptide (TPR) repeat protein